jgi:flagellar transcriptional activator FlhD
MNTEQILSEIREANLSYLMLAQSLIRSDREQALFRLGISEESAELIALLSPAQMMRIASGNTLLCRFRMDDDLVWGLLTNHGERHHLPPACQHPDGWPSPRSRLSFDEATIHISIRSTAWRAPRASSPKPSRSTGRSR